MNSVVLSNPVIASEAWKFTPQEVAVIRIDPRYLRPTELETLLGDPIKAKQRLGWVPEITAQGMYAEMVPLPLPLPLSLPCRLPPRKLS